MLGGEPIRTKHFTRWPVYDEREKAALIEVLESGVWGGFSPKISEFERAFAAYHGAAHGVAASNGTVTLEAALFAAGIQAGDEVIVPAISFVATATAVLRVGAVPVFVDIDPGTYNIVPAQIEEAISDRTRAIMPVHFAGQLADMDAVQSIAARHGLIVIEDAAHAHGSSWRGRRAGSFGEFGSFSFQASKSMTAGEGGILITNDAELAQRAREACNLGRRTGTPQYVHVSLGSNCRLTGWQAAVLLVQFSRLEEQIARREANARLLDKLLAEIGVAEPSTVDPRNTRHSYYLYMVRLKRDRLAGISKNRFVAALTAEGIPCGAAYPHPLYCNPVFKHHAHRRLPCPEAERMCAECFWLSHEVMLSSPEDVGDVAGAIAKVAQASPELARARALEV
jgi:dTDP-4-amino-4,6-dideoxygalactose transaminase